MYSYSKKVYPLYDVCLLSQSINRSILHSLNIELYFKFFQQEEKQACLHAIVASSIAIPLKSNLFEDARLAQIIGDAKVLFRLLFHSQSFKAIRGITSDRPC